MENKKLENCVCKKIPRIKLFFAAKDHPLLCKECNSYLYIEPILVLAFLNSGFALILAAFFLFAVYKGLGLLILAGACFCISILFRLIELYILKIHFISEEEKRFREQRRPLSIGLLIGLILILLAILFYNYNH